MKTLLFCPLFIDNQERLERNIKWFDYYYNLKELKWDELYMVDNASDKKLLQEFVDHVNKTDVKGTINVCKTRLERRETHAYGYWYNAFGKAARYAKEHKFDRIIHIDSDVFVLKPELVEHINNFKEGWQAFWCSMYNYPESTFQLIGKDQFNNMYEFMTRDFLAFYPDDIAETRIPWTHVEKSFKGDRYGEKELQQDNTMSWYGQTPVKIPIKYNMP